MTPASRRGCAALLLLGALGACSATPVEPPGPPASSLAGYRIVYRVTTVADTETTTRRVVTVLRPFASRDETFVADEPTPSSVNITSPDRISAVQGGHALDLGARAPQPPPADYRFSIELDDLRRAGMAVPRGSASYAGRSCRVYRFGAPLGDRLAPVGSKEYADLCIDGDGLVLGEEWVIGKKPARRTEAVEVDTTPPPASEFAPVTPSGDDQLPLTQVAEALPLDTLPKIGAHYWVAAAPPWGLRLTHRSRVVSVSQVTGVPQVDAVAYLDTYERGPDVITVERRQSRDEIEASDDVAARSVRVPRLGTLDVDLTAEGPQLVLAPRRGWRLTVSGTVDVARLAWFARALR